MAVAPQPEKTIRVSARSSASRMVRQGWEGRGSVNRGQGSVHFGTGVLLRPFGRNSIKRGSTTKPQVTKGLHLCGSVGQVGRAVLGRRGGRPDIHWVIDKLALPHFSSAPVTTRIMPK